MQTWCIASNLRCNYFPILTSLKLPYVLQPEIQWNMACRCVWWPFPSLFALLKGSCFTYFSGSYFLTHCGVLPRQLMSLEHFFPMLCTTLYSIFSSDGASGVFFFCKISALYLTYFLIFYRLRLWIFWDWFQGVVFQVWRVFYKYFLF